MVDMQNSSLSPTHPSSSRLGLHPIREKKIIIIINNNWIKKYIKKERMKRNVFQEKRQVTSQQTGKMG